MVFIFYLPINVVPIQLHCETETFKTNIIFQINWEKKKKKKLTTTLKCFWYKHVYNNRFQGELDELCIKTEMVIDMALDIASNEMDYTNILLYLHHTYNSHPPIRYFKKKTNQLYKKMTSRIQSLTEELLYKKEHGIYFKTPKYSGVCMLHTSQYNKKLALKNVNSYLNRLFRIHWVFKRFFF